MDVFNFDTLGALCKSEKSDSQRCCQHEVPVSVVESVLSVMEKPSAQNKLTPKRLAPWWTALKANAAKCWSHSTQQGRTARCANYTVTIFKQLFYVGLNWEQGKKCQMFSVKTWRLQTPAGAANTRQPFFSTTHMLNSVCAQLPRRPEWGICWSGTPWRSSLYPFIQSLSSGLAGKCVYGVRGRITLHRVCMWQPPDVPVESWAIGATVCASRQ